MQSAIISSDQLFLPPRNRNRAERIMRASDSCITSSFAVRGSMGGEGTVCAAPSGIASSGPRLDGDCGSTVLLSVGGDGCDSAGLLPAAGSGCDSVSGSSSIKPQAFIECIATRQQYSSSLSASRSSEERPG